MENLGIVVTPHPLAGVTREEIRKRAEAAIYDMIKIWTHAPEAERVKEKPAIAVIKVTGKDYADAFDKFNRLFLVENRWGDGLPLVPPTREYVDWMLTGTDRSPDEVIVETRPSGRAATVEAIAINAVMAGAIPAYMPLIIAALQAFDAIPWGWGSVTTTSSVAPFVVVNGPIAKQLDINSKTNAMGYGWRANASIGRTLELIFSTVGGAIPGFTDMSTLGCPSTFTSRVFAENEDVLEDLGWPTFAEERGFDKRANAVSVTVAPVGYRTWFHYEPKTAEEFMENLIWAVAPLNFMGGGPEFRQLAVFVLNPEGAKILADSGWTKEDIRYCLATRASKKWSVPIKECLDVIDWSKSWYTDKAPKWFKALPDDYPISIFPSDVGDIYIFVAGGAGKESHYYPNYDLCPVVTKEIKLPKNWEEILQKADIATMPMLKLPW